MKIPLVDICDFKGGTQPPKDEWIDHEEPGYIRMLQIRDFTQSEKNNIEYVKDTSNLKKCTPDDILIGRYGASVGKILTGLSGAYNVAIVKTVPNKEKVCPQFLFHYFNAPYFQNHISSVGSRAAQAGFNKDDLGKLYFPLLPLDEQRRIAAVLDKVSGLIAKRREQLDKLDELVKARFVEMFGDCKTNPKGWKTCYLEDIAEVGSSKRVFVEELKDEGIPFYRGTEVGALAEGMVITPELFITEEHYKDLCEMTGKPQKGDLLMPSICPDGRIWLVDTDAPFYFKDGRVLWVHGISDKFDPVFLLYTLKDRITTDYSSIASGTTFAELKIFALKKCQVFNAPVELQKKFSAFISVTNKSKLTIQQSLDKLEVLKKALMQQYFG